jgi:hypothetical protein
MSNEVKVNFSIGLLLIVIAGAVVHAVLSDTLSTRSTKAIMLEKDRLDIPVYHSRNQQGSVKTLPQPYPTNYAAQGEVKQQCGPDGCVVNPSNPYGLRPGETLVNVGPARVVQPVQPAPQVLPQQVAPKIVEAEKKRPAPKTYQLLLFLDESAKSQDLLTWFKTDARLIEVKNASAVQIYTKTNALYQERYSKLVAPTEFPALVLQDATGGHIHACGKGMIPNSVDELYADMKEAYGLYKQAKQGSTVVQASSPGAMKTEGYSWDDQILPAMRLQDLSDECGPDGCDPPGWQPGERVRDGLDRVFNRNQDKNALLWLSASEMVAPAIVGVLVVLILLIAVNKLKGS